MDREVRHALHYETLLTALRGSETKAEEAFDRAKELLDINEPFDRNYAEYARLLDRDIAAVRQAYEENVRAFGNLEGRIRIIGRESPLWPRQVSMFAYIPRFLYVRGDVNLLKQPIVSVIGTRSPSLEGRKLAYQSALSLARGNFVVASGLALGIDAIAHKSVLSEGEKTIAVIGTPLNQTYPAEHKELQAIIGKQGAVVSRFGPATRTQKFHFLLRNRLMSALSLASVVVEDRDGGGAVRQASFALEQKRLLFFYQQSLDNHAVLWPRQFLGKERVYVIKKPTQLPGAVAKAVKGIQNTAKELQKIKQLELFD
ncbi:MAG: DNA-processing protein DprA [Spirochaetales bacterium]|nr:DNA-processing protein DprA [Spirochaetales bacterium]